MRKRTLELSSSTNLNEQQRSPGPPTQTFTPNENRSRKFTPLSGVSPAKRVPFSQLKFSSAHTSQSKKTKKLKRWPLRFDEVQAFDDQTEFNSYAMSPHQDGAITTFRNIYKKIDSIMEKKVMFKNNKKSLFSSMLQKSKQEGLLPKQLGSIRPNSQNPRVLDASHFRMGDRYAQVLCQGLQDAPQHFDQINLKNNNLTYQSSDSLKHLVSGRVKTLNLQGNSLGLKSAGEFVRSLNTRFGQLEHLDLENNKFKDDAAITLFTQLINNSKIVRLNLSRNNITDKSVVALKELLIKNYNIAEIYLHWNTIHAEGGQLILQALQLNTTLKVLDLSFNSLGIANQKKSTVKPEQWGDYLSSKACALMHLDLSNNHFTLQQTEYISKQLENNHHMFGFHFKGNQQTQIDYMGFLNVMINKPLENEVIKGFVMKKEEDFQSDVIGPLHHRRIDGITALPRGHVNKNEICWICDGWVEQTFYWTPGPLDINQEPIFIHLSHERYAPIKMEMVEDINHFDRQHRMSNKANHGPKTWIAKRMVPSKQPVSFFFSSPMLRHCNISQKYPIAQWNRGEAQKRVVFYTTSGNVITFKRPHECNQLTLKPHSIFEEQGYDTNTTCQPRIKDMSGLLDIVLPEDMQTQEKEEENYFKGCHKDEESEFIQCFEYDWNKGSIPKIIKDADQLEAVKQYLHMIYRDIVAAYRWYSAYSPSGDVWCIPLNQYTEIFSQNLIDKGYQLKDLDIMFKQCTSQLNNESRSNTAHALLRFQFMEIMVRLAMDKYCRIMPNITPVDALQRMYEQDGLQKKIEQVQESQDWRESKYWTSQCNRVIIDNQSYLQKLFEIAVSNRQLNYFTTKQFVPPLAFKDMFTNAQLINDQNAERNVNLSYCLSVQLVVDEVIQDRHMQMNFNEFVEALARVADKMGYAKTVQNSPEELATKLQQLIASLMQFYEIQDEPKVAPQPGRQQRLQRKRTTFIQMNMNQMLFEDDGTPMHKDTHDVQKD